MAQLSPQELMELFDRYFDQELDQQGQAQLAEVLRQEAGARDLFIKAATIQRTWHEWAQFETNLHESNVALPDADESRRIDEEVWQSMLDDSFAARKRAEVASQAQAMLDQDQQNKQVRLRPEDQKHSKRKDILIIIPHAAVWGGIAAGLLLAVWVVISLTSGPTSSTTPGPEIASPTVPTNPTIPADPTPPQPVPVLAQVDESRFAVWSADELGPDQAGEMRPGRYSLKQGAVSVKMSRGAGLVIQSPATFELLDDNRIELTSGRLVARVPVEASGFSV